MNTKVKTMGQFVTIDFGTAAEADANVAAVRRLIELVQQAPVPDNRPPEGWSGPDKLGHFTYVWHDAPATAEPPEKEGYDAYWVGRHGLSWTRWVYRPI